MKSVDGVHKNAVEAFKLGDYQRVIDLLESYPNYENNKEIDDLLKLASSNLYAGIHIGVPPREDFEKYFTKNYLTSGPKPGSIESPIGEIIKPHSKFTYPVHLCRLILNRILGYVTTFVFRIATVLAGWIDKLCHTGIWTNWYRGFKWLPEFLDNNLKILRLAHLRETLFEDNLIDTYPDESTTGFYQGKHECPPRRALFARTEDGSWNWLPRNLWNKPIKGPHIKHDPMVGAAMTRFYRNVGDDIGIESVRPRQYPGSNPVNVLEISNKLLARDEFIEIPFLNLTAAAWIQFMVHDWVSHGDNRMDAIDKIPFPLNDPRRDKYQLDAMTVQRTQSDPSRDPKDADNPPTFINEVTHWWDASQLYGSNRETIAKLRKDTNGDKIEDGKLFMVDGRLPLETIGDNPDYKIEKTGFNRNWWLGLSLLHTLFANEHNSICDMLKVQYPKMSGDELFLKARLINAAVIAKIHTIEWTLAILPNKTLYDGMHANWYGLLSNLFDSRKHKKTIAEIKVQNRELGGIIGNPPYGIKSKYALSEEFTAVYRMHSMLPDIVNITSRGNSDQNEEFSLINLRQSGAHKIMDKYPIEDLWYSFGIQHSGALVLNNYPDTLRNLSIAEIPFQDLAAVDVYRDRERGIPNYNQLRRELSLTPIQSFDDISPDQNTAALLREVYGRGTDGTDKVEDVDLLIGTLAEGYRPTGFGFGETLFQVFLLNATWRLLGDRFYTDDYRAGVYTEEGLNWIDETDMRTVLTRHYPGLEDTTGLRNINNAFEPWEEDILTPAMHPLRTMDERTRDDPWTIAIQK